MGRGWRPILVGGAVVVGTFALAKAQSVRALGARGAVGRDRGRDPRRDRLRARVLGLPRPGGDGRRRRPDARRSRPRRGHRDRSGAARPRVMPAGLVSGQEEADVVAYVVSISTPSD